MNNKDKITEVRKIQQLIVDGGDSNEINARVWCLVNDREFNCIDQDGWFEYVIHSCGRGGCVKHDQKEIKHFYSTSLDTCQSIMLGGWKVNKIREYDTGGFVVGISQPNKEVHKFSPYLPTMAEAWLYAILESYIYEWSRGDE